jgi:subtilase family serine protease
MSLSYGECELGQGTAGNVAFYDLWQKAAAEGISVFVATGDAGSPACDDQMDQQFGNPYVAQYGLSVSGLASTPYNTAVGGTDFTWCQPYYNSSGNFEGCPASSSSQGTPAYWNTTNNTTTGESAAGYIPETPWNDTCENPIWAKYLETLLSASGADSEFGVSASTPEEACNLIYNDWSSFYQFFEEEYSDDLILAPFVDTVGGSGGASNCVVNTTNPNGTTLGTCTAGSTTTGSTNGSIALTNDGWPSPSWQAQSGVTGTSGITTRAIPDISFFAGDGSLDSATLICVSNLGACETSAEVGTNPVTTEPTAQEVGGTSVATPEMAGVMALINQNAGGAQGLANPQLYELAAKQNYSSCSAESVKTSSSCYFNDVDEGTNTMPCNLTGTEEGGYPAGPYIGTASPNCVAVNSGDTIGTLVSSGTTPAYNAGTGFDLASGLGSLNVANVVNAWVSDAGTAATTMTVKASPTTITINQSLTVTVTVAGSGNPTPTGTLTLTGGGYSAIETIGTSPCTSNTSCTFTIPANSLAAGSNITLTAYYDGDANYAANSQTAKQPTLL